MLRRKRMAHRRWYGGVLSKCLDEKGNANVFMSERSGKRYRYAKDWGNTLISTRWRWILLSLCVANGVAWVLFALMWMTLSVLNGDRDKGESEGACIVGTRHFTGYLLLSIETLTTIGFGEIHPATCHHSWIVLTLQALTGVIIEGALVTAVYVKMTKPSHEYSKKLFSKKAILCLRDGKLCLVFRIYDEIGRFWAATKIKACLIGGKHTKEGVLLQNFMQKLKLEDCGLMMGPADVVHVFDSESPLWNYSAKDILTSRFEILIIIQGDSVTTGQTSECRKSYSTKDILWGFRFMHCVDYDDTTGKYVVHREKFNATFMCEAPLCSAATYEKIKNEITRRERSKSI